MQKKTVAFCITAQCGERCPHCFVKAQSDLSLSEFEMQLDALLERDPEVQKIVITGGDPELNTDFFAMCRAVQKRGLRVKVHGNYARPETWPTYLSHIDECAIPLDTLSDKGFRDPISQQRYIEAFLFFLPHKKIQVHTMVSKRNLSELQDIQAFLQQHNFFAENNWKLFRFIPMNAEQQSYALTDVDWKKIKKQYTAPHVLFVDNVLEYK